MGKWSKKRWREWGRGWGKLKVLEKLLHASDARKSPGKGEEKTEPEKRATHFCVRGQEEMRQRRRKCCHMFFLCHFRFLFLFIFISPQPEFPRIFPRSRNTQKLSTLLSSDFVFSLDSCPRVVFPLGAFHNCQPSARSRPIKVQI